MKNPNKKLLAAISAYFVVRARCSIKALAMPMYHLGPREMMYVDKKKWDISKQKLISNVFDAAKPDFEESDCNSCNFLFIDGTHEYRMTEESFPNWESVVPKIKIELIHEYSPGKCQRDYTYTVSANKLTEQDVRQMQKEGRIYAGGVISIRPPWPKVDPVYRVFVHSDYSDFYRDGHC